MVFLDSRREDFPRPASSGVLHVILSAAKDLWPGTTQILRCAHDDKTPGCHPERSEGSLADFWAITRTPHLAEILSMRYNYNRIVAYMCRYEKIKGRLYGFSTCQSIDHW